MPEGAQTGRRLRLGGKGMSRLRSSNRGDLHVEIFVEVPVNLSAKQREVAAGVTRHLLLEVSPPKLRLFGQGEEHLRQGRPAERLKPRLTANAKTRLLTARSFRMADQPIRIAIAGALGFMGRELIKLVAASDDLILAGGVDLPDAAIGQDLGTLIGAKPVNAALYASAAEAAANADVLIDFSIGSAAAANASGLANKGLRFVIGATGFEPAHETAIAEAAKSTAILKSGKMSLGVNLIAALARQAAAHLGEDWDIEIVEAHHRRKVDAPSGTALMLGRAVAEGRKVDLSAAKIPARDGITGARPKGGIGFAVLAAAALSATTMWCSRPTMKL